MTSATLWIIGILTLAESALGIHTFFQIYEAGLWVDLLTYEGAQIAYYSVVMPIAAIVIGLSTLKNKHWSWRANIILQVTIIALLLYIVVPLYVEVPQAIFLLNLRLLPLILASVILFLLLRRRRMSHV